MSIWLLTNEVGRDAADYFVADNTHDAANIGADELLNQDVVIGGPRHLIYGSTSSIAARRYIYRNLSGTMSCDFLVASDFATQVGNRVLLRYYTTYPTSITEVDHNPFAEQLIGINQTDWVHQFSAQRTSLEAVGLQLTGTTVKQLGKIYFCNGLEFPYMEGRTPVSYQPVSVHEFPARPYGHYYHLHAKASFTVANVSRADLDTYYALPQYDPVFFYDDTGTSTVGTEIEHKLWHCIIMGAQVQEITDDLYTIKFELGILRHWR